ncbi:hypothetical protein [Chryseobacterium indologenes]|uniref:hypothetical protein n=1 Tax=Chryseobacterium indologenes TaxID=253 RepID=UPI004058C980
MLLLAQSQETLPAGKKDTKKYRYKVNTSLSYDFLKDRIIGLLFSNSDINKAMEELKTLFKAYLIPIRPQRSIKRNIGKYRARAKLIDSKNQKDTL